MLAAARELLTEVGLEAVTVLAVARRAGVDRATVHRNWSGRDTLVRDAVASLPLPTVTGDGRDAADPDGLRAALDTPPWDRLLPQLVGAAVDDPGLAELLRTWARTQRDALAAGLAAAAGGSDGDGVAAQRPRADALMGALLLRRYLTGEDLRGAEPPGEGPGGAEPSGAAPRGAALRETGIRDTGTRDTGTLETTAVPTPPPPRRRTSKNAGSIRRR